MLILHGDNLIQSRLKLVEIINQNKSLGVDVTKIDAGTLNRAGLEQQLQVRTLFGESRLMVIENLFTLPKSKKKEELITLIKTASQDKELSSQLITWDGKNIPVTTLKKINLAQVLEFKTSPVVFKWLDALNGHRLRINTQIQLFHQAVDSDGVELCLAMLTRQIRLLIQIAEKRPIAAPPFIIKKLTQQANSFSLDQLLRLHHQLVQIDREIKSSQLSMSLDKKLDLLILNM